MEDFRIEVPQDALDDLRERLGRTRWPDQIEGSGWDYGTDTAYLRELCEYWRTEFDWRAAEARLNTWPQLITVIDGQRIHAIHARSPHPGAVPLLLTHGWPGSVAEFLDVIGPLIDPPDPADAFHVICPSLPGYAWSGPTTQPGWDVERVAVALDELMHRLGYDRYVAQGGDWGSLVTAWLGAHVPDRLVGLHLNMPLARRPENPDMSALTESERAGLERYARFRATGQGYSMLQGTTPQTLAPALHDSPAGQAGWIIEKFRAWSDCGGDLESVFRRDRLLTNIASYWLTGTAGSSARLYFETKRAGTFGPPPGYVTVPTGVAVFPAEIGQVPRAWVEECFAVRHWTTFDRGGHFAAMERPEALLTDIRDFVRPLR